MGIAFFFESPVENQLDDILDHLLVSDVKHADLRQKETHIKKDDRCKQGEEPGAGFVPEHNHRGKLTAFFLIDFKIALFRRRFNILLILNLFKTLLRKEITMEQPDALRMVADFHETFKHPILPEPGIPSEDRCKLRVSLIAEELKELEHAIRDKDIVEVADALCDIQYVLSGAILEFGLAEKFKTLFEEVQRSNMSKACNSEEEARQTVAYYKERDGTECYYRQEGEKWLVYRTVDNKTIKSIGYSPADLTRILNR